MRQRIPPTFVWIALGAILSVGSFEWGTAKASSPSGRRRTEVVEAVQHASPAVVSVDAWLRRRTHGAGAGVIVHPAGIVVTNSHVIRGAYRISVQPFRSGQAFQARVVADDPGGDLALLQILGDHQWPYVSLCASRDVLLGETAIAIGNPRGLGDSITVGVVSAVGRQAKVANGARLRNLLQTDASINTGNSGGPLLNLDGELIGVNTSVLPTAKGIAFAISADQVQVLLRRALGQTAPPNPIPPVTGPPVAVAPRPPRASSERVQLPGAAPRTSSERTPHLGMPGEGEIQPLRPSDLGLALLDDGCRLLIQRVGADSPAVQAGLRGGDLLLEIDGFPVENQNDVIIALAVSRPGRNFEFRIRRDGADLRMILAVPR